MGPAVTKNRVNTEHVEEFTDFHIKLFILFYSKYILIVLVEIIEMEIFKLIL